MVSIKSPSCHHKPSPRRSLLRQSERNGAMRICLTALPRALRPKPPLQYTSTDRARNFSIFEKQHLGAALLWRRATSMRHCCHHNTLSRAFASLIRRYKSRWFIDPMRPYGVRRQAQRPTALWIRRLIESVKAVSRFACHRSPQERKHYWGFVDRSKEAVRSRRRRTVPLLTTARFTVAAIDRLLRQHWQLLLLPVARLLSQNLHLCLHAGPLPLQLVATGILFLRTS